MSNNPLIIEQILNATVLWWARLVTLPVVSGITAVVVAYLRVRNEGKASGLEI